MKTKSRKVRLKEVCDRITVGHVGSMKDEYVSEGVSFLRSQNIQPFRLNLADIKFVTQTFHAKLKKSALKPGDVAVVRTGYPGTACVIPKSLPVSNCSDLVIISPNATELDSGYLAALFNSSWGMATVGGNLVGAAQQHFNVGAAKEMEIDLPSLATQRKITGILSAYDDLIENNLLRIKILEEMAQSLYREWFVHFHFPGHESVKLVDSPLGRIPEGWEVMKLGELSDQMRRGVPKGELDEPVPYVGLEHIPRQSLALDAWEETTELGSNKLTFERGEVLFGKIRPYFHKVSVAPFDGICSADTIVIRSKKPEHRALVTSCVFTEAFVAQAAATSNGSKMPRTDWKVLKDYPLVLPPKELLSHFSAFVENTIAQQQNLIFRNQTLRQTRDLLLPKLLESGS
jgi:type I restriction enzyme S subunit